MVDILLHLQKFVPNARDAHAVETQKERDDSISNMRRLPVGGDQLTCERLRGAHGAREDADTPEERLEGVFAMVEDFHEKMNFLQATMDKLYKTESAREGGTLTQLRNLVNRRNVVKDVHKDYHADSSFFDLVTDCHVLVAAMSHLGMTKLDDSPKCLSPLMGITSKEHRKKFLYSIGKQIIDKFLFPSMFASLECIEENRDQCHSEGQDDYVFNYAISVLKLGLLRRVAVMTTHCGDGDRMLRNWKFSLLLYHSTNKYKYKLEAFLLVAGIVALLPPRLAHQVQWNRFVNLSGDKFGNLDGDYVMELLNREAKMRIKSLGPNHSAQSVDKIGKTILFTRNIRLKLENELGVSKISRQHAKRDLSVDRNKIIDELRHSRVLDIIPGREHKSFPRMPRDPFDNIVPKELHTWISEKKALYNSQTKWAL